MSLLPSSPDVVPDTDPRVVGVDSEDADALMSALSSGTARRLLAELHDEPAPPSALAERADTSLQNAQYHLANLEDAGAVEVVGTAYSEKGREMDVYAPADRPLVIFAGNDEQTSGLRAALARLIGGIAALAVGALVVQELFGRSVVNRLAGLGGQPAAPTGGADGGGAGGDGGEDDAGGIAGDGDGGDGGGGDGDAGDAGDAGGGDADGATESPTPEAEAADGGGAGTPTETTGGDVTASDAEAETATPEPEAAETATEVATETAADAATPTPTATPMETVTEAGDAAFDGGAAAVSALPPGLLFFLGGLTVLLAAVLLAYR